MSVLKYLYLWSNMLILRISVSELLKLCVVSDVVYVRYSVCDVLVICEVSQTVDHLVYKKANESSNGVFSNIDIM